MASRTIGVSEPFSRSTERSRTKRMGGLIQAPREERPTLARKNTPEKKDPSQSRMLSRIPQTASTRRPSLPDNTHSRPPLTHQNHSLGPVRTPAPSRYASNFPSTSSTLFPAKTQRNVLRRKHSNISQEVNNLRTDSTDSSRTSSSSTQRPPVTREPSVTPSLDRALTDSPMEVRIAQTVEIATTTAQETMVYPELDRYQNYKPPYRSDSPIEVPFKIATHDLPPPPTPLFSGNGSHSQLSGYSVSPSTRFSESPGPGPYSRDTTPTSMCSQSPGLITAVRIPGPRMRQGSISPGQIRPPVTRRRAGSIPNEADSMSADPHGLPSVRESQPSPPSNSTVRDMNKKDKTRVVGEKRSHLAAPPPSPPPRKSSQKFKKDGAGAESPARKPRQVVTSPAKSPPSKPPVSSRTPPARPSRDGTPDLQAQQFPIPVVQSNLSSTSIHERRQSSGLMPSALPRTTTSSQHQTKPSRLVHRREPTPAPVTSAPETRAPSKPEDRAARTPSPSMSSFKTRFPLFGRRKTEPVASTLDRSAAKAPRKGPAAGTGHEGYGRVGSVRRRSASNGANVVRGVPSSQESLSASSDITDPFLLERMQPIVIAGGGEVVENRNTSSEISRVESNGSLAGLTSGRPSVEIENSSSATLASQGGRTTMWPTIFPQNPSRTGSRRPSAASTDSEGHGTQTRPTLAFRRSIQKLKSSPDAQVKIPKPIIIRPPGAVTSPSATSIESTGGILSDDSTVPPRPEPLPATTGPRKLTKKPGRWNFFSRSQAKKAQEQPQVESTPVSAPSSQAQRKAVAFYAMVDSSDQDDEVVLDVEDILLEANVLPPNAISSREYRRPSVNEEGRRPTASITEQRRRRASSGSIPRGSLHVLNSSGGNSPPKYTAHVRASSTSVVPTSAPAMIDPFASTRSAPVIPEPQPKRSRLPQVGRIPKVVSNRPPQPPQTQASASPKSFSRPFQRLSTQYSTPPLQALAHFPSLDAQSVAKGPSPPRTATPELTREESTVTTGNSRMSRDMLSHPLVGEGTEFLAFSPPRKGSACTSSTSSCSGNILSYADATAIVPLPDAPLADDEIWDEYNDLLGYVPPSASSSHGKPFYLEAVGTQLESPTINVPMVLPLDIVKDKDQKGRFRISNAPTSSSVYSQDMTARIAEVMAAGETTPFSVSEFVGAYGERNHSIDMSPMVMANRESKDKKETLVSLLGREAPMPAKEKPQLPSQRSSQSSKRTNSTSSSRLTMEDQSPLAQVNLRVGSMTVSKWLTFGHVLFSPVREAVEGDDAAPESPADASASPLANTDSDLKRASILVIDGLGNDDWSFYAAETYPDATFFNLSPRAPLNQEQKLASGSIPLTPANHHQIQYMDHTGRFPFAADSFTSVVYRFPVAAPESHYRNIIAEARRVLKPGGYLELSLLDSDLNNMGIKGRRAIRALKEKIHAVRPDCNLASTADLALRLLNRRGFTDVKTCKVGVPVASVLNKRDRETSSSASGIKAKKDNSREAKERRRKERDPLEQRSLADMMNDDSPLADEGITQMVARVGRWWYTRCYEGAAGITAKDSMWRDKSLLQECEEWGTSLKLTVCYAQKPVGVGRVASI